MHREKEAGSRGKVKPFLNAEYHIFSMESGLKTPGMVLLLSGCSHDGIPATYVVFKPLKHVDLSHEKPRTFIFFVDPDQLSALVNLANYGREDNENVFMPYAAGCQTIVIYPYEEAKSEKPRAVVGLTDISARVYIRKQLGANLMTVAIPFIMFEEMEQNVEGSFLEGHTWQSLASKES